jgi:hypothetical protein
MRVFEMSKKRRPVKQAWAPDPLDDPKRIANWPAFQREQRVASKKKAAAKKRQKLAKMRKELGLPGFSRSSFDKEKRILLELSLAVFHPSENGALEHRSSPAIPSYSPLMTIFDKIDPGYTIRLI